MNMFRTIQRGLVVVSLGLVCLIAGTINVQAASVDTETELISSVPSGPASDPDFSSDSADDSALESCEDNDCSVSETPTETYVGRFTTTAYCSCRKCCRSGKNLTKSGTIPQAGRTISADLNVFPLGTKLRIGGVVYTVEDSGSGIRGNKLDIFFNSHSQALQYGRQSADVYVIQ